NAVTIDLQNRVITAGTIVTDGQQRFVTARLLPSGLLDTTQFGATSRIPGTVEADFSPLTHIQTKGDSAQAMALQTINGEQKIVVVGIALVQQAPLRYGLAVVRYNSNGTLDRTFGTVVNGNRTGMVVDTFDSFTAQGYSVAIDAL